MALSTAKLKEWLAADLSGLDLLVIQIDGLHVGDLVLVATIGIGGARDKTRTGTGLGRDGERCRGQGVAGRLDRARAAIGVSPACSSLIQSLSGRRRAPKSSPKINSACAARDRARPHELYDDN